MLINEKFFQGLPKEFQAIVKNAALTRRFPRTGSITSENSQGLQFLKDKGMEVYVPTVG